jgi:ABC-type uncharacterized transport system substrate-binding protein
VAPHPVISATRRTILAGIAAVFAPGPLAAAAQPPGGMRRLGVLLGRSASEPDGLAITAAFIQALGARHWKESGSLHIDWRWAGSDPALFKRYAAELVALGPEVILAQSSPAVAALRQLTTTIPIVFVNVFDPVGQGFVAGLAQPGGNIAGFSNFDPPMAGKWLQMLTRITPPVARAAFLFNPATAPYAPLALRAVGAAAGSLGVKVRPAPYRDESEIDTIMAGFAREEHGGLLVLPSAFAFSHRDAIVALAARHRLPAVYGSRLFVAAGGLMSYGVDLIDPFRRAADYVDRILKGAKPADLPVQAPTKFEMVINLKTAKALGVTIPPVLLAQADEVIE